MSKVTKRTKRIAITTAVMLALGGGVGIAYWSATGKGAVDTAKAGTSAAFTINADPGQAAALTPGGPGATVTFTVGHTGTGTQRLAKVVASVKTGTGGDWAQGNCSARDFTVSKATITSVGGTSTGATSPENPVNIPAGSSATGTITVSMVDDPARDQNDCKEVQVPLYFTAQ